MSAMDPKFHDAAVPVLAQPVIREVLGDWLGAFSQRDLRRIGNDSRAVALADYVRVHTIDPINREPGWDQSVEALLLHQARLLLRARACQIVGSRMTATVLARAANARRYKSMRRGRDSIIAEWATSAAEPDKSERNSTAIVRERKVA